MTWVGILPNLSVIHSRNSQGLYRSFHLGSIRPLLGECIVWLVQKETLLLRIRAVSKTGDVVTQTYWWSVGNKGI